MKAQHNEERQRDKRESKSWRKRMRQRGAIDRAESKTQEGTKIRRGSRTIAKGQAETKRDKV